ncbi:MAG: tRNA dihydrouridine synthase DusB [Pseudomonadales bacterium]|nr:tRNA dihydrouridine synthase DusB [Pseudomonadales bacterium]MBO7006141.1 tRNA dihydrouridine synthase DusB [Pseudomonadales bacterium]
MLSIGSHSHPSRVIVAPMAGVTDRPFRDLCRAFGAHWAVSEMVTADKNLWSTRKSRHRLAHASETGPRWVQLAGSEPNQIAEAAKLNVDLGADIIDINMGCPAKKVCNKAAGSSLLRDEHLVSDILHAVVSAASVPVTLKIRLGWSWDEVNAPTIAHIAEDAGIQLLTVHGRTRACRFNGHANYDAIATVKQSVQIPVIANGDIDSAEKAAHVLKVTGCDGVMIGRAAQGSPWLIGDIDTFIRKGEERLVPRLRDVKQMLLHHVGALHEFYGEYQGLRIARKHVGWTLDGIEGADVMKKIFNRIEVAGDQLALIDTLDELEQAA